MEGVASLIRSITKPSWRRTASRVPPMPFRGAVACGALVACMLSGCVSTPKGHSAEVLQIAQSLGAERQDFLLCSSEGLLALHMARSYISSNRDRNAVLPYIGPSAFDKALAAELFRRVDAGEIAY